MFAQIQWAVNSGFQLINWKIKKPKTKKGNLNLKPHSKSCLMLNQQHGTNNNSSSSSKK